MTGPKINLGHAAKGLPVAATPHQILFRGASGFDHPASPHWRTHNFMTMMPEGRAIFDSKKTQKRRKRYSKYAGAACRRPRGKVGGNLFPAFGLGQSGSSGVCVLRARPPFVAHRNFFSVGIFSRGLVLQSTLGETVRTYRLLAAGARGGSIRNYQLLRAARSRKFLCMLAWLGRSAHGSLSCPAVLILLAFSTGGSIPHKTGGGGDLRASDGEPSITPEERPRAWERCVPVPTMPSHRR